jgi:hypothetical protein
MNMLKNQRRDPEGKNGNGVPRLYLQKRLTGGWEETCIVKRALKNFNAIKDTVFWISSSFLLLEGSDLKISLM